MTTTLSGHESGNVSGIIIFVSWGHERVLLGPCIRPLPKHSPTGMQSWLVSAARYPGCQVAPKYLGLLNLPRAVRHHRTPGHPGWTIWAPTRVLTHLAHMGVSPALSLVALGHPLFPVALAWSPERRCVSPPATVTRPSQPCAICDTLPNLFLPPTTRSRREVAINSDRSQFLCHRCEERSRRFLPSRRSQEAGSREFSKTQCRIARGGDAKPKPHSPVLTADSRSLFISIAFSTQHSIHHSEATVFPDNKSLENRQKQSPIKLLDKETLSMLSRRAAPTTATIPHHVTVQSTDRLQ